MSGTLYIVPTPIGNLEDMTHRGIRILKEVDLVLCEDTSVTQRLFKAYDITTKTSLFYSQSPKEKVPQVIALLEEGKNIALVSDAGTPAISDPGVILIDAIRRELPEAKVIALPGASALITAVSGAGLAGNSFIFLGFLPHKKGRDTIFRELLEREETAVFYESVHRIEKTLSSLATVLPENRLVVVARELTKIHEEYVRGSAQEVRDYFQNNPDKVRGEFVVLISGIH